MKLSVLVSPLLISFFSQVCVVVCAEVNDSEQMEQYNSDYHDIEETQNKIVTAQYECYQRVTKDQTKTHHGVLVCNATWDGWLCWEDTQAGYTTEQHCPDYYGDFDTTEVASKECTETGQWFRHPQSNRTWSDYTRCRSQQQAMKQMTMNLFYLTLIGHGLSLTSLFISLAIFFYFKSLSCQRITLHKNLFFSFVLNSIITSIYYTAAMGNQGLAQSNPVICKVIMFLQLYLFGCNYFWMLCEGIYLHTLIVVAVFAEKQHLMWYYLLGWGFPLIPALIHAVARIIYYNDTCWFSSNTSLLYIMHSPIWAALIVNLFFLLNIVRVLITKLKVTHQTESSLYTKAVRATLILVPLLGIQFVLLPYKPQERLSNQIYHYVMCILINYQGLLVATIFCFFNGEVQSVLRRHWHQQRIQFGGRLGHGDAFRSASYVASSLTEVHRCYSNEQVNGKSYSDVDGNLEYVNRKSFQDADLILRSDSLY